MSGKNGIRCEACKWWKGECKRRSPTPVFIPYLNMVKSVWPEVEESDECGDCESSKDNLNG